MLVKLHQNVNRKLPSPLSILKFYLTLDKTFKNYSFIQFVYSISLFGGRRKVLLILWLSFHFVLIFFFPFHLFSVLG